MAYPVRSHPVPDAVPTNDRKSVHITGIGDNVTIASRYPRYLQGTIFFSLDYS